MPKTPDDLAERVWLRPEESDLVVGRVVRNFFDDQYDVIGVYETQVVLKPRIPKQPVETVSRRDFCWRFLVLKV